MAVEAVVSSRATRAARGNVTLACDSAQNRSPSTRPFSAYTSRLMSEVVTCTPSSSRSSGARRKVITLHRPPRGLAATANLTGALSRDTPVPELNLPVNVPCATTPLDVGRKRVIFAVIDSLDDVAPLWRETGLAPADGAATAATASIAKAAATSLRIDSLLGK